MKATRDDGLMNSRTLNLLRRQDVAKKKMYGRSFDLFSGIYGAPVKPRAIRWLSQQSRCDSAWIIEPDAVYSGSKWTTLFDKFHSANTSDLVDLVAFNTTFRHLQLNKTKWNQFEGCSFCRGLNKEHLQGALLPVHRVSRRLAIELFGFLSTQSKSAHHEVMIPTYVTVHSDNFTWTDLKPEVAYVEWRPIIDPQRFRSLTEISIPKGKLYHPVKSAEIYKKFIEC